MGGGCRNIPGRETIIAGGWCENHCFSNHGGCNASDDLVPKQETSCELKAPSNEPLLMSVEEINKKIEELTAQGKSIFLYTPDMFSDSYFESLFQQLPSRNGNTHIAINAGVRTFRDKIEDMKEIKDKGIREIWVGVESADPNIRDVYCKPSFSNQEVIELTQEAKAVGINVCWYLVDGHKDNDITRLATYGLIREGNPYRVNIENLA